MGGEKISSDYRIPMVRGSPPRERGKGKARNAVTHQLRIAPAWAGKSCMNRWSRGPGEDHPRMGGEKPFLFCGGSSDSGSPPRGRGKAELSAAIDHVLGITPAWAGKRPCLPSGSSSSRDHPRMGGEKFHRWQRSDLRHGLPPRGRGKELSWIVWESSFRITPAWAGKRRSSSAPALMWWDHPRVGGEKPASAKAASYAQGSPPHGRGKVEAPQVYHRQGGITPA